MSAFGGGRIVHDDLVFMVDYDDPQSWISGSLYWINKTESPFSVDIYSSHSQFDEDGRPIMDKVAPCTITWDQSEMKLMQNDFTVQFWWKRTGAAGTGSLGGSNSYHSILSGVGDGQVIINSAGGLVGWWGRIGASIYHFTTNDNSNCPLNEWVFWTFKKTNDQGSFWYRNDVLISTSANYTASLDNSAVGSFTFGRNDNYVPNGVLPVVMVYDRVLTEDEILSNYRSSKSRFK